MMRDADSLVTYSIAARLNDSTWVTTDSARNHYTLGLSGFVQLSCQAMSPNMPAALKSRNGAADIQIFPNPSDGDIQIKGLKKNWEITVLNIAGKKIKQLKGNSNHASIQNLPSGFYIINITDNNYSRIKNAKIWVK
jgi:hypothetical protein